MVLKRKLPSQLAKEQANSAPDAVAETASATAITDFEATPTPTKSASIPQTDKFTADALKEAASALAAEMGDTAPKSDLYLDDPFDDIDDVTPPAPTQPVPTPQVAAPQAAETKEAAPEKAFEPIKIDAENAAYLDTFADIDTPPASAPAAPKPEAATPLEEASAAVADIDEKPTPSQEAPKQEAAVAAPVIPASLKRKNRNKRKRAKLATSSTEAAPQEQTPSASQERNTSNTAPTQESKPDNMELAAQHKPDDAQTKSNVDRAFKEMAGLPDPAAQEIEAAYIPPAEVEPEAVYGAPKPDIAKLLAEEVSAPEEKPDPKASIPAPEKSPEKAADYSAPMSFAETEKEAAAPEESTNPEAAPTSEKLSKKEQKARAEDKPEIQAQPESAATSPAAMPTISFSEPQSFADITAEDKKAEPLPWEADATANEEENAWDLAPNPVSTSPAPDIYAQEQAETPAPTAPKTETEPEAPKSSDGFTMPFLSTLQKQISPAAKDTAAPDAGATPDGALPPPELPTTGQIKAKSFNARPLLAIAALIVVSILGYKIFTNKDSTQDRVARFTGALDNTPEQLPAQGSTSEPALGGQSPIQPQQVITQDELARLNKELEEDLARLNPTPENAAPSTSQIDFVDVTAEEANAPIVAAPDEALPGEKGFVASLQDAISSERQKRGIEPKKPSEPDSNANLPPEERLYESQDLQAQVQAELEAYRKALSGSDAGLPIKPNQFFGTVNEQGVLLPPKARKSAGAEGLPASEIYTENPYNLPVLAEPESDPVPTVRSLNDFDVAMFEPPKAKVRIPQGLKPRLRASDFPEVTALSFVPNKGMIAHANGREGVLLIGEMIEGWELFAVTQNHAEFRSGQRKYYVNLD